MDIRKGRHLPWIGEAPASAEVVYTDPDTEERHRRWRQIVEEANTRHLPKAVIISQHEERAKEMEQEVTEGEQESTEGNIEE